MRARYGVSFVSSKFDWCFAAVIDILKYHDIVPRYNGTALYLKFVFTFICHHTVLLTLEYAITIDVDDFIHPNLSEFRVRPVSHLIGLANNFMVFYIESNVTWWTEYNFECFLISIASRKVTACQYISDLLILIYCLSTDVIMGSIATQITSLTIFYTNVYWGAYQRKHQSSASLAFVWGIINNIMPSISNYLSLCSQSLLKDPVL